jgi:hypothetical protein
VIVWYEVGNRSMGRLGMVIRLNILAIPTNICFDKFIF